jgi:hypothetical protein
VERRQPPIPCVEAGSISSFFYTDIYAQKTGILPMLQIAAPINAKYSDNLLLETIPEINAPTITPAIVRNN